MNHAAVICGETAGVNLNVTLKVAGLQLLFLFIHPIMT